MPNYDYECQSCSRVFEVFQSITAEPLEKCDECGGDVKRLIGGGLGVIFKGSGYYVTDNAKKCPQAEKTSSAKASTEKTGCSCSGGSCPK